MSHELKPHQIAVFERIKNGCILKGGVGSGKSITAMAYFVNKVCGAELRINGWGCPGMPTRPRDLYIITTARKRDDLDWFKEVGRFALSSDPASSLGGIRVVVDSWNNIQKYVGVENAFFIFDEQKLVGTGPWVKAFYKIAKANQWMMLSATPGDNWMDYAPVFIAHGYFKNITEFKRLHVKYSNWSKYPKIEGYVEEGKLQRMRRQIVIDMPYERHTKRHIHSVPVDFNREAYQRVFTDRWNIYDNVPIKDVAEWYRLQRKIVNSDVSRQGAIMEILEKHPRLIVFYNFNYELEMLRVLSNVLGIPTAEWNGFKHEEVPETESWLYLVQYTAGAEAWNCTATDAVAFWSLNYSYKVTEQSRGRIDRMNTPYVDLHYYVLESGSWIDRAVGRSLRTKTNFNEKAHQPKI